MKNLTVVEQMYEQLEVNDPAFWNAAMIRDWLIENKQRFLQIEREQLVEAYHQGLLSELDGYYGTDYIGKEDAEQYYNETYGKK